MNGGTLSGSAQMRVVRSLSGWLWLRGSFRILGRQFGLWLALVFTYWTAVLLIYRLPYLGVAAFLMTTPAFTLSFMHMAREAEAGRPLHPRMLIAGFRNNLPALITLGGIYLVANLAIVGITTLWHGETLAGAMRGDRAAAENIEIAIATLLSLYLPVMLAFWFAAPLCAWHGLNAGKALFFSLFAALRNWRAMLVYGMSVFALWSLALFAFSSIARVVIPAFAPQAGAPAAGGLALAGLMATPLVIAGLALQFISYYLCYRDVFGASEERTPVTAPDH